MYISILLYIAYLLVAWYATLLCTTLGMLTLLRAVERFLRNDAILRK